MATLRHNADGDICVTLRGAAENRLLVTLRGWTHWLRYEFERDPQNPALCLSVTLITSPLHEVAVRELFKRGFGMTFPPEGGSCAPPPPVIEPPRRRGALAR
jgi:hypothetical protein